MELEFIDDTNAEKREKYYYLFKLKDLWPYLSHKSHKRIGEEGGRYLVDHALALVELWTSRFEGGLFRVICVFVILKRSGLHVMTRFHYLLNEAVRYEYFCLALEKYQAYFCCDIVFPSLGQKKYVRLWQRYLTDYMDIYSYQDLCILVYELHISKKILNWDWSFKN